MIQEKTRLFVSQYCSEVSELLGDRLDSIYLFGSSARGESEQSSDIDLAFVIRGEFDYGPMIDLTSESTARSSLANDAVISRVFVSERDFLSSNLPFYRNLRREGIRL